MAQLGFSVDELLAVTGRIQCQHRLVPGLPLWEVWRNAQEVLNMAAKSRPAEDAHVLQVTKHFAKVALAATEFATVMAQLAPEQQALW